MAIEKKMSRLSMLKKADTIFQVTVLACSVILAVVTQTYPARTRVFPELILYTLIFLSGTCLFLKFVSPRFLQYLVAPEPEEEEDDEVIRARRLSAIRFYWGWLTIGISVSVLILFGFVFSIPVYFITYTLFLGNRKNLLEVTLVALFTTAMVYLIFGYFLYLPMVGGLLFG